jgi:cellulose synthase/poly-beta-1,6-N-acetylglucosamine synthase-like glycosyltransferase
MSKASNDLILISDADVQVSKNYLQDLVSFSKDPSVGIATNLIRGKGNDSLGSRLENLNLNFLKERSSSAKLGSGYLNE